MIIFGWRSRASTKSEGSFHCPVCRKDSIYKHKLLRYWATLYFLPLFPVDTIGECIDCQECGSRFNTDVLTHNHKYQKQAAIEEAQNNLTAAIFVVVKNIMVKIASMGGSITQSEITCITEVLSKITRENITTAQVNKFIAEMKPEKISISEYATQIQEHIKNLDKEQILKAAIKVANASGEVSEEKREVLYKLADDLRLPSEYIKDIFEEAKIAA